jgi:hypothetical protein
MLHTSDNELETRENLIRYFTKYLSMELTKVNSAFRFIRIETPILTNGQLRSSTASASYDVCKELTTSKNGPKYRLPLVLWQHGKIFKANKRITSELYALEYHVLFSKTTGIEYRPIIIRCCETMLRKQCGKIFKADEDASGMTFFTHDTDAELAFIGERADFWGGKNIHIRFNLDTCTNVNIQHEFGKIRRSAPVDKK